jgi:oxygen-independent coproporphyrinogen-3 oxidase
MWFIPKQNQTMEFNKESLEKRPLVDLDDASLAIGNLGEKPTREEFYTNYPFFKHWKNETNSYALYPNGINIYIHIPFCIQICDYCFYMKELIKSKSQVDIYIETLRQEMKTASEALGLKRRIVNSIYIGGGTPSVLTEEQFNKLMEALHKFHDIQNVEFTFEAEPGTFNKNKLGWYKNAGVNRISMGVQSFDDQIIKYSSRKHSASQAIKSVDMIKEMGGFSINVDLLSGLAGETMQTWTDSLKIAVDQQVDMLTLYKMKTYANTVFFKKGVRTNEIKLPTDKEELQFMEIALDYISGTNYEPWSSFAFTNNGYRHRYAENTWRGQDLIAYGVSSFGKVGNVNYQNINNMDTYTEKVQKGLFPLYRSYTLSQKDLMVKELLLCGARLASYSKQEFIQKFGFDYFSFIPETISELSAKGYITENRNELTLTKQGMLFGDFVGKVLAAGLKSKLGEDNIGFSY